jgi:hypothetical protein
MELRKRMHDPIVKTGTWVWQMLNGHLNYFAVSGNDKSLWWFCKRGALAIVLRPMTNEPHLRECVQ